jgi:hypothetical protein
MRINHITLLTGDSVLHRLDTIDPAALAACTALLPSGGQIPSFPAYRVEIHGPIFTLYRGREPLVTCGLGSGPDEVWQTLHHLQQQFGPVKAKAPIGRWLAVVILPPLVTLTKSDISWLADFERSLAAAILTQRTADD